jgi:hypothetical protein
MTPELELWLLRAEHTMLCARLLDAQSRQQPHETTPDPGTYSTRATWNVPEYGQQPIQQVAPIDSPTPTVEDVESLRRQLTELEEKIRSLEIDLAMENAFDLAGVTEQGLSKQGMAELASEVHALDAVTTVENPGHATDLVLPVALAVALGTQQLVEAGKEIADRIEALGGAQARAELAEMLAVSREDASAAASHVFESMFPEQTKELQELAEKHVAEQEVLDQHIHMIADNYRNEHATDPPEKQAADQARLEQAAQAERAAQQQRQAEELQRMQAQMAPPERF